VEGADKEAWAFQKWSTEVGNLHYQTSMEIMRYKFKGQHR